MQDPNIVAKDVADFRKQFQKVQYTFDNTLGAYEYINLVGTNQIYNEQ
jgi:glycine hydroxymethyltransferase